MEKYDTGNKPLPDLKGKLCFGGLDLASSDDIAALVLLFPPEEEGGEYYVLPHFWIPEENLQRRVKKDHVPYDKWVAQGYLEVTEGNIIHYDFIEQKIVELSEQYHIFEVMYDRWGAIQMAQNLQGHDFKMTDFGQGYKSLSPPSKELFRIVLDEKLIHGNNPVLRWMFENVFIETDAAGNIKPSKKKAAKKSTARWRLLWHWTEQSVVRTNKSTKLELSSTTRIRAKSPVTGTSSNRLVLIMYLCTSV